MTEYKKLVEALRWCSVDEYVPYKGFPMDEETHGKELLEKGYLYILHQRAAAAIEELQQIADHYEQTAKDCWKEACEYKAQLPKRGEWIDRYDEDDKPFFKRKYVCSACGGWNTYGKSKYCPNCGAKMEVQE